MNDTEKKLLKLVFDKENDIFFWQYKAVNETKMSDRDLFQALSNLSMLTYIEFDSFMPGMKYVNNVCLTYKGLDYLHENGLVSYFDYVIRTKCILRGQHEV